MVEQQTQTFTGGVIAAVLSPAFNTAPSATHNSPPEKLNQRIIRQLAKRIERCVRRHFAAAGNTTRENKLAVAHKWNYMADRQRLQWWDKLLLPLRTAVTH